MTVTTYATSKDSGVEWLGRVPTGWQITRLGNLLREVIEPGVAELPVLSVSIHDGVSDSEIDPDDMERRVNRSEDRTKYKRVQSNDLVYNMMRAWQGGFGTVHTEGMVSPAYVVARPISNAPTSFIEQALRTPAAVEEMRRNSKGVTDFRLRLYWPEFKNIKMAIPPPDEVDAIMRFLDRETAKIDALVEEQRRLIELLKEKRQAVISHAVTKGLDPAAPIKASAVEWLGEVPAHWLVTPIRKVARLESGHTPSRSRPEWWQDCTVPWFSLADVWQIREAKRDYVYETKEKVSDLGLANSSARLLPANTVMLSRTASVGFSAIMGVPMATTQDFANWVCSERLSPEFLLQVFRGMSGEFRRLMMGSTHNTIYMPDIQSMTMALPPRDEQERIVEHIKRLAVQYDDLSREAEKAVELLRERRAALISAAVTGKIEIRKGASEVVAA